MFKPASPGLLTIVLLNWKRPDNLRRVLDDLGRQTLRPEIFLWNNGGPFAHPAVAWQVDSSANKMCWPRWFMASMASTEFIAVLDDDLTFRDERVLEDAVERARAMPPRTALGYAGAVLHDMRNYGECDHVHSDAAGDRQVDIVKGRFMLLRTADLRTVHLEPDPPREVLMSDDIMICGALADGRKGRHLVPAVLAGRFRELPGHDGLNLEPTHGAYREKARRRAFTA